MLIDMLLLGGVAVGLMLAVFAIFWPVKFCYYCGYEFEDDDQVHLTLAMKPMCGRCWRSRVLEKQDGERREGKAMNLNEKDYRVWIRRLPQHSRWDYRVVVQRLADGMTRQEGVCGSWMTAEAVAERLLRELGAGAEGESRVLPSQDRES